MSPITGPPGNPVLLRERAAELARVGRQLAAVADALAQVSTGSWSGRAAERFRERFGTEPGRWRTASRHVTEAAEAIDRYAAALQRWQSTSGHSERTREQLGGPAQLDGVPEASSWSVPAAAAADDPESVDQVAAQVAIHLRRLAVLAPRERRWLGSGPTTDGASAAAADRSAQSRPHAVTAGPPGSPPTGFEQPTQPAVLDWATVFALAPPDPLLVDLVRPDGVADWRAEWGPSDDPPPAVPWTIDRDFLPGPPVPVGAWLDDPSRAGLDGR